MHEIPKGWEKVKFEDVLKYEQPSKYIVKSTKYNNDYKTPVLTAGKGFILGYTNETDGIFKDTPVIIFDDFTTSSQYVNFHFKVKSSAMKILRPVDNVNLKFLFYKMQTIQHKSDTHKRYWISEYAKREIYIPNLVEQKAIADKLDDSFAKIENAITNLINAKENLKLYKQSVLKSAFNGDLVPSTSPTHWEVKKLKDIGKISSGGTPSTSNDNNFGGNIAWITPADLTGYKDKFISKGKRNLSEAGLKNSSAKILPKGTILFSSRAPIGYVAIAQNEISTNQGFKNLTPNESVISEYVYYYLLGSKNLAEQSASGTTFKEISATAFSNLPIPLPPLSEQNLIVAEIDRRFAIVDKTLNLIDKSIQNAKNLKQSILKKAFSGELRSDI